MSKVTSVNVSESLFHIHRDLSVSVARQEFGPPKRIDGISVGIVTLDKSPPHGGEVHPDGDEILYLISGKLRVVGDTSPPLELDAGQACVVAKGEWHKVEVLEPAQLVYVTPGPNGDHRPL